MIYRLCRTAVSIILFISLVVQSPAAALESVAATELDDLSNAASLAAAEKPPVVDNESVPADAVPPVVQTAAPLEPGPVETPPLSGRASVQITQSSQEEDSTEIVDQEEGPTPPEIAPPKSLLAPVITEVMVSGTCPDPTVCTGNSLEFIELFNPNTEDVLPLTGMKLRYQSGTSSSEVDLVDLGDVTLEPGAIAVFARNLPSLKPFTQALADAGGSIRLVQGVQMELLDQVGWGKTSKHFYGQPAVAPATNKSLQRCVVDGRPVSLAERVTSSEFLVYPDTLPTPGEALACPVSDPSPEPEPEPAVNRCEGLRLTEIAAHATDQFVELHNNSETSLDIAGCRLQTNRSTVFYSLPSEQLAPDAYRTVRIVDTRLSLTKTTAGTVYLLSSDGAIEIDSQSYSRLAADTAWALFPDGEWRQTYLQTPGAENQYQQYQPCESGYERSEETGRCRKQVVETSVLADCGEGRYRHEETGRCRNLVVAAAVTPCAAGQYRNLETGRCRALSSISGSSLTPCKEGQERNPETNRCRSVASTVATALKPCAAGQERNPDTNRCRKVVSGDGTAGFKVVETPAGSDKLLSWLALGGVGMVSVGYMVWQWRRELVGGLGRILAWRPFGK